jgi:hypothetical protein
MTSGLPVVSGREAIRVFKRLSYASCGSGAAMDGQYRIVGAASGAPIARVEVRIDGGQWLPATLDRSEEAAFAWKIWSLDWPNPRPGEHDVTSRAIDTAGNIQPASDDACIGGRRTYWESNGQVTRRLRIN